MGDNIRLHYVPPDCESPLAMAEFYGAAVEIRRGPRRWVVTPGDSIARVAVRWAAALGSAVPHA